MKYRKWSVAWGYMGAVIGAGFASGQELVQFFVAYGREGLWGTILAGFLFAGFGGLLLLWINANQLDNYQAVLKSLFGAKCVIVMDTLLAVFLFLGVCTMFAASGAVFYEHINQSQLTGIVTAYFGVLIFLMAGRNGLIKAYNLFVPLKFLLLLTVAGYAAFTGGRVALSGAIPAHLINPPTSDWVTASVLYVAYNFALALVVLSEYRSLTTAWEGIKGAVLGGLMLGVVALVCYWALLPNMPTILHYQVPMLFVAGGISPFARTVYMIVLWLGILTTAIANTYGFAQRFSQITRLSYGLCLILTVTMALPLAFQSFSFLVATIYPLLGFLGLIILVALVYKVVVFGIGSVLSK